MIFMFARGIQTHNLTWPHPHQGLVMQFLFAQSASGSMAAFEGIHVDQTVYCCSLPTGKELNCVHRTLCVATQDCTERHDTRH